jgi:hypothetical protein
MFGEDAAHVAWPLNRGISERRKEHAMPELDVLRSFLNECIQIFCEHGITFLKILLLKHFLQVINRDLFPELFKFRKNLDKFNDR